MIAPQLKPRPSTANLVARRILKEIALPTLCALGWSLAAYVKGKAGYEMAAAAGVAFSFALYIQGQFLRVIKNVRDERSFQGLSDSIGNLKAAIDDLRLRSGPSTTRPFGLHSPAATSFMSEAEKALEVGAYRAALVLAAIAFEQAIRRTAERFGLFTTGPASRLLQQIGQKIGNEGTVGELMALLRVRNELVHPRSNETFPTERDAQLAIDGFQWGIDYLDSLQPHDP